MLHYLIFYKLNFINSCMHCVSTNPPNLPPPTHTRDVTHTLLMFTCNHVLYIYIYLKD